MQVISEGLALRVEEFVA
jgi:hypothetical protein